MKLSEKQFCYMTKEELIKEICVINDYAVELEDKQKCILDKVKDLLYDIRNEFDNELDYDYESESGKELTETDFELMTEYLDRFLNKVYMCIDNVLLDKESEK